MKKQAAKQSRKLSKVRNTDQSKASKERLYPKSNDQNFSSLRNETFQYEKLKQQDPYQVTENATFASGNISKMVPDQDHQIPHPSQMDSFEKVAYGH